MKTYHPHPAALTQPPPKPEQFEAIKRSIEQDGQHFPAVLHEGKLLDGRTRQEAIRQLVAEKRINPKTELKVVQFRGGSIPGFVRSANNDRRHLTEGQLAMVARKLLPLFQKEAKERQAAAAKSTNRKKKSGQKSLTLSAPGHKAKTAAQQAAEATGGKVSARSVQRADFIAKNDPKLADAVFKGEITPKQAEKKLRRRELEKVVAKYVPPEGKFQLITTDFPWEYDDKRDGNDAQRGGCPYPPMTLNEILAFVRGPMAACCDETCLLGVWVTNPIMLDLKIWASVQHEIQKLGFEPACLDTWLKVELSGADFVGLGSVHRNNTEQFVLFRRGAVLVNEMGAAHGRSLQHTCFTAPIGDHSEKPQLAYDRLEQLVPYITRLEMFARAQRFGWRTSGAELAEPPALGHSAPAVAGAAGHVLAADAATSFSDSAASGISESERSDALPFDPGARIDLGPDGTGLLPPEYECANCHATFVALEILTKHSKACGELVAPIIITSNAERDAARVEIQRLTAEHGAPGLIVMLERAVAEYELIPF